MRRKPWIAVGAALAAALLIIQIVPYGRDHTNPPVTGVPRWDSPRTEELARRACFDCHSNETHWPWYASIAPMSWRVQHHVDEGRRQLNLSELDRPQKEAGEAAEVVGEGQMPLRDYLLAHPEARLTETERADLARGLAATLSGASGNRRSPDARSESGEDDDDD